jgi:putative ABC transport system permease protein
MSLIRLSIRNTRRQPKRTILTILAIAAAVAFTTFFDAYINGTMESFLTSLIRMDYGHVKIVPEKGYQRTRPLSLDDGFYDMNRIIEIVEEVEGVEQVSPRIKFGVLLDGGDKSIPAMGNALILSREKGLMDIEDYVIQGRIPSDTSAEVLVGYELAERLGLGIGDEFFFVTSTSYGGLGPGVYEIVGLSKSGIGMVDRSIFYIPLVEAQYQLAMEDRALEIVCKVKDGMENSIEMGNKISQALKDAGITGLAVVSWNEQGAMVDSVGSAKYMGKVVMFLFGIIAITTVINTVLISVMERVREIGALRALGFGRRYIVKMILLETSFLGAIGTIVGLFVGLSISIWLNHTGIDFTVLMEGIDIPMSTIVYPQPSLGLAIQSGIFGMLISLVAAWYPARVAIRLQPAKALGTHR